jgi:protein-disulfide isomerase
MQTVGHQLNPPIADRDHLQGPRTALVTLAEYGDFQCPYCGQAHPIIKEVMKSLEGKLLFAFRHFPLTTIHPQAQLAAEAAEAAGIQGKFWEMHDMLYENQGALAPDDLVEYAHQLGLDTKRFARELQEQTHFPRVREDFLSGIKSGVNGTPTFFINGWRHDGAWDLESLTAALQHAEENAGPPSRR